MGQATEWGRAARPAPTAADVQAAARRIAPYIHETPLFTSRLLNDVSGAELVFKAEHLQRTGSFKLRGAMNKLLALQREGRSHVVAASSSNHGSAVAYAARLLGMQATIVVPRSITPAKRAAIEAYGGRIEVVGEGSEERLERARSIARETGAAYVAPYDDPLVIAGQGTVGLELLKAFSEVEAIYVPIGGGGLISGIATWVKAEAPHVRIIGVEPELADDTHRSLLSGRRVRLRSAQTIADGLRALSPGELTFPIVARLVDDVVRVSDEEIVTAVALLMTRLKQVVEPSGATSVAAALRPGGPTRRAAVLSGGNVDWKALWPELEKAFRRLKI